VCVCVHTSIPGVNDDAVSTAPVGGRQNTLISKQVIDCIQ